MKTTDKKAKELWCPMVRAVRHEPNDLHDGGPQQAIGGCNSGGVAARSPVSCRCIGSACAMWRWDEAGLIEEDPDRFGHCGLAGPAAFT